MSDNTQIPTKVVANAIVANAKDLPAVVIEAKKDPAVWLVFAKAFAPLLIGKSALGSKTIWFQLTVPLTTGLAAWLLSKYGLDMDLAQQAEVAGVAAWLIGTIGGVVMRLITKEPITSLLPSATAIPQENSNVVTTS